MSSKIYTKSVSKIGNFILPLTQKYKEFSNSKLDNNNA